MKRLLGLCLVLLTVSALGAQVRDDFDEGAPLIQVALLLDTSNSMDGLINQAKGQLWKIVSHAGRETRKGRSPRLEVALYEYGNDSLSLLNGYVRQVVPFTTDLDSLSQALFELDTNGGSEYCGKVISQAHRQLDWDSRPETLRLLFIAGNEPFDQGPVDFSRAVQTAYEGDITVNTIFCGDYGEGQATYWERGALLGGGAYMNINSDYRHSYIQAPQDERIEELNRRLNETYLSFGAEGEIRKQRQEAQDSNAQGLGMGSLLERAKVKSSSSYSNSDWDLVDAYEEDGETLEMVAEAELPEEMQEMDREEREAYLEGMKEEREAIQEEITRLSQERELYLAEQASLMNEEAESTLDSAIIDAMRKSAEAKGFELE
ncbi:MAG: VWA domain-containing protein [Spirochaetales bacterium]|nr:VWA domain-containing protein [Spirochaetales bacterium]